MVLARSSDQHWWERGRGSWRSEEDRPWKICLALVASSTASASSGVLGPYREGGFPNRTFRNPRGVGTRATTSENLKIKHFLPLSPPLPQVFHLVRKSKFNQVPLYLITGISRYCILSFHKHTHDFFLYFSSIPFSPIFSLLYFPAYLLFSYQCVFSFLLSLLWFKFLIIFFNFNFFFLFHCPIFFSNLFSRCSVSLLTLLFSYWCLLLSLEFIVIYIFNYLLNFNFVFLFLVQFIFVIYFLVVIFNAIPNIFIFILFSFLLIILHS